MKKDKKFIITSFIISILSIINGILLSIVLKNNWNNVDIIRIIENNKSEIVFLTNDSFNVISCIFIVFLFISGIYILFRKDYLIIRLYIIGYILLFIAFMINEILKINTYPESFSQSASALALYVLISSIISLIIEILLISKVIKNTNGLILHIIITGIILSDSMLLIIHYFDFIDKIETLLFIYNNSFSDFVLLTSLILLLIAIPTHIILIFLSYSFKFIFSDDIMIEE